MSKITTADTDDESSVNPPKEAGRKKKYPDRELVAILDKEFRQSMGAPTSEVAHHRLRNLQFYKAEAKGELAAPSIPDRSQFVASDVADTVEWMLPSLVRVFAASPESMECKPRKRQYVPQAKLASEYLRHVFWNKNNGFSLLCDLFRDGLVQKVGFLKVEQVEEKRDIEEFYKGLTADEVERLTTDEDIEIIEKEERTESVTMIGTDGHPVVQEVPVWDLLVKQEESESRCKVSVVPPEEMRVHPRARYGQTPLFIGQEYYMTQAELEAEGYDLTGVGGNGEGWSMEMIERANTQTPFFIDASDGEMRRILVREAYIQLDDDGDGVPETLRVFMIGTKVMERDKVPEHPYIEFCPIPAAHTFFGFCPADFAVEPQRARTQLLRSVFDNTYLSVNRRTGVVEGQVNLDDLLLSRPGGIVRMKNPNAMVPIEQGGLDPSAWQLVDWTEQWREQRTGFTRYSQGLSPDALNPTATGVGIITEKADQRNELIARVAADSLRRMFTKMLACMCRYQDRSEMVELAGEWVEIDPRLWKNGFDVTVQAGLGTGSKDKKAAVLQGVLQIQQPLAQAQVIPPQAVIKAARDFCDANGLTAVEDYFPDAQQPQPQPHPDQIKGQNQLQLAQVKAQADAQVAQIQAQTTAQVEQIKAQAKAMVDQHAQQVQQAQYEAQARVEQQTEQFKAALQQALEEQRLQFEAWKTEQDNQTKILVAQIQAGAKAQAQPLNPPPFSG